MLRLGLCCQFAAEPIHFKTTTATSLQKIERPAQLAKLALLAETNAAALTQSLHYCATHQIGAFRVNSQILPLKTHPVVGYDITELPHHETIVQAFRDCKALAQEHGLRFSFHPDQFVVLNSPNPNTVAHSIAELTYQAEVADWIGADTLNVHGGGAYGDKPSALKTLRERIENLPDSIRTKLTLENDDKTYTPEDLLPVCLATQTPLVYDVHHHRCLPDTLSIAEATDRARSTWSKEPLFHLSSPLEGWQGPKPERHHDYIDPADFPREWLGWPLTVEVEAKAKELAIARLQADLQQFSDSSGKMTS